MAAWNPFSAHDTANRATRKGNAQLEAEIGRAFLFSEDRRAGGTVPADLDWRAARIVVPEMRIARVDTRRLDRGPCGEEVHDTGQGAAVLCQPVLEARRPLAVGPGCQEAVALHPPEAVGEDVGRNARDRLGQFAEASGTIQEGPDDPQAPAVTQPVER